MHERMMRVFAISSGVSFVVMCVNGMLFVNGFRPLSVLAWIAIASLGTFACSVLGLAITALLTLVKGRPTKDP